MRSFKPSTACVPPAPIALIAVSATTATRRPNVPWLATSNPWQVHACACMRLQALACACVHLHLLACACMRMHALACACMRFHALACTRLAHACMHDPWHIALHAMLALQETMCMRTCIHTCSLAEESSACLHGLLGNGRCNARCNDLACGWDGGDCSVAEITEQCVTAVAASHGSVTSSRRPL